MTFLKLPDVRILDFWGGGWRMCQKLATFFGPIEPHTDLDEIKFKLSGLLLADLTSLQQLI